jgi:hypothetical protein
MKHSLHICPFVALLLFGAPPALRSQADAQSAMVAILLAPWATGSVDSLFVSPKPLPPDTEMVMTMAYALDASSHAVSDDYHGDSAFAQAWTEYAHPVPGSLKLDIPAIGAQLARPVSVRADPPPARQGQETWLWMAVSKAGFSRDSSIGIIHRVYWCGRECGGSDIVVFRQHNGSWAIDHAYQGWRS